MARFVPASIETYGGIEPFLRATKDKHNGYDDRDLIKNWKWGEKGGMNVSNLAIMFGVSWPTMDDYINRLHVAHDLPRPGRDIANISKTDDNK